MLQPQHASVLLPTFGYGYAPADSFSAEAQDYFDRLDTAGDTTYTTYKQPLANYIDGLVALGGAYWDTMLSATSFVGVGIQGVTVPLRDGMTVPTNNNFVVGDLNPLTGLKSDGSTKSLDSSVLNSALGLNDASVSIYITELDTLQDGYIGAGNSITSVRLFGSATRKYGSDREQINSNRTEINVVSNNSLNGMSRSNSSNYNFYDGSDNTVVSASTGNSGGGIFIFGTNSGTRIGNARLATYHIGPALNLATLGALQDTLISEIAAI